MRRRWRRLRRLRELMPSDRLPKDRVGLGWRPELAVGILEMLDHIDVLEIIADNHLAADRHHRAALRALARQVGVHVHSIALGMAGAESVSRTRLDCVARLVNDIEPEAWSEHLAFTRAGGIEIGHLAAPPRTSASIESAVKNLRRACEVVGTAPLMENIATLVAPPCSTLSEAHWIAEIATAGRCDLLLDLHNLHANALNFGFDPLKFLAEIPLERVGAIHIAGGRWITSPNSDKHYLLDDHLHAVDEPVYALLSEVAARVPQPLTVILERDGDYPPMSALLEELRRARAAIADGRRRCRSEAADLSAVLAHRRPGKADAG